MKKYNRFWIIAAVFAMCVCSSCIDQDMNKDPTTANEDQVEPQWFLNGSIGGAQLNPDISQRISSLTWKVASRQVRDIGEGFSAGKEENGYIQEYFSTSYAIGWLRDADNAIRIAKERIDNGKAKALPYYKNIYQMSRIWRDYVLTEIADGIGPIPLKGFDGENPHFNSVKDIYLFVLADLKEASESLDQSISMNGFDSNTDPIYGRDKKTEINNWAKYGNSLRMRAAMRLSVVDPQIARSNFEDAAKSGIYIDDLSSIAEVPEEPGWNSYRSILGVEFDHLGITKTFTNLTFNLGHQEYICPSGEDDLKKYFLDPETNLGIKMDYNLPSPNTNDPTTGYFFNGIPQYVDPRVSALYDVPKVLDERYPALGMFQDGDAHPDVVSINYDYQDGGKPIHTVLRLNVKGTFASIPDGEWDTKYSNRSTHLIDQAYPFPAISNFFRQSQLARVMFGSWETCFLMAEAKLYGWNVPGSDQEWYEKGIKESFNYFDNDQYMKTNVVKVMPLYDAYIKDTHYNRVGTSVAYNHTDEAKPYSINYTSIYPDKKGGTATYNYPKNSIYQGGQFNNDKLTKILTQKYIAQMPWQGLEPWCDHRRLGLPFFETSCADIDMSQDMCPIPLHNKDCKWEYFPQRFRYPDQLRNQDLNGYNEAVQLLNGRDHVATPLWWSGEASHK